jgi:hypothetical protein
MSAPGQDPGIGNTPAALTSAPQPLQLRAALASGTCGSLEAEMAAPERPRCRGRWPTDGPAR